MHGATRTMALLLAFCAALVSCGPGYKRNPVPPELAYEAHVPGLEFDRVLGPQRAHMGAELRRAEFIEDLRTSDHFKVPPTFLSLSGGGQHGAFGAGLLYGWTEHGSRPEFSYVTGISTGALLAPFAFLGPEYDERMREVYTTIETKDLVRRRGLLRALLGDAMLNTKGLREAIQRIYTDEMIDEIGRQHDRGRRLIIGTTNLDLMLPVYWGASAIANSDSPDRYELVRKILLASASIPVAFPPVYFTVTAGGELYDEMHVDGGAANQLFAYPSMVDMDAELEELGISVEGWRLFVIRNAFMQPEYEQVAPNLGAIAGRSISSMIRTQGIGDIYQIFLLAQRDGLEFNLAFIPPEFNEEWDEDFDPDYMTHLFEFARARASGGYPWMGVPERYRDN